jgi:hypothetical protein
MTPHYQAMEIFLLQLSREGVRDMIDCMVSCTKEPDKAPNNPDGEFAECDGVGEFRMSLPVNLLLLVQCCWFRISSIFLGCTAEPDLERSNH